MPAAGPFPAGPMPPPGLTPEEEPLPPPEEPPLPPEPPYVRSDSLYRIVALQIALNPPSSVVAVIIAV